ncbi:hypothetical protein SCL_1650 [Sulfuricaulis limicola]|uniref:NHL repeat containing protein n=2 Tax=Sulfuricaulis limicola TaxID=1620215 RepID=A0A1B4XGN0_9GAMM|nr:hypothetical protein SCL_1650 [Sulfuricaulis limicola]
MPLTSAVRVSVLTGTIFLVAFLLAACNGGGGGGGTVVPPPTSGTGSQLYVSGNTSPRLLIYNDANTVSGGTLPNRVVSGGLTTLSGPRGIAVDMAHDQIYVANFLNDSILVFHNARIVTGGDAPDRMITGATMDGPSALFVDVVNNRLFVANTNGNSILIYDNASALNGNVAPTRALTGAMTTLNAPIDVCADATRNLVYVANGNGQILVFNNAAIVASSNDIAPLRSIPISSGVVGIFVDIMADRLYVASANSVLIFDGASRANSGSTPNRTITGGGSMLNQPRDIFVDTGTDRLYVANFGGNSVLVFNNASIVNGSTAPDRNLSLTASTGPWGIYVDVTPIVVGSTSSLAGFIEFDGSAYTAISNGGSPRTGDDEPSLFTGSRARQLFSFDLSNIPTTATVGAAILRLYQASQVGTPFNDLGSVVVDHVSYGATLDNSPGDYEGGLLALLGIFSTSDTIGYRTLDVTARVNSDVTNMRSRSQYRLRFSPLEINGDAASDHVQYTDAEDSCCGVSQPPQLAITIQP